MSPTAGLRIVAAGNAMGKMYAKVNKSDLMTDSGKTPSRTRIPDTALKVVDTFNRKTVHGMLGMRSQSHGSKL